MKVTNYIMYSNAVRVFLDNGRVVDIYFNQDSGKIYYRYKTGTISSVKHAGIYIGQDAAGKGYFIHNHYQLGSPQLVYYSDFTLGEALYIYHERCVNPWNIVVSNALSHAVRQEPFKLLSYNCQTLVNSSCNNQRNSEDVQKWIGRTAVGLGLFAVLGLILSE